MLAPRHKSVQWKEQSTMTNHLPLRRTRKMVISDSPPATGFFIPFFFTHRLPKFSEQLPGTNCPETKPNWTVGTAPSWLRGTRATVLWDRPPQLRPGERLWVIQTRCLEPEVGPRSQGAAQWLCTCEILGSFRVLQKEKRKRKRDREKESETERENRKDGPEKGRDTSCSYLPLASATVPLRTYWCKCFWCFHIETLQCISFLFCFFLIE